MIPEKFSVKNLYSVEGFYIRLKCKNYSPILYTSNPQLHGDVQYCFDSNGYRKVGTITLDLEFSRVYDENFEEFKEAINKILIKEML